MDAGGPDAGSDAGTDAGGTDGGGTDAGGMDAGGPDGAPTDAGPPPSGAYTISPYDDMVRQIDLSDGMTLSMTAITLAGFTVVGANGMAVNGSGVVYVALRVEDDVGRATRRLVTLDVGTGIATDIGQLMNNVANIAFDGAGTLYAVTGEMGTTTETLFTVNTGDATMTMFLTLGNGDDGEAIGFNPIDGFLYHASGLTERVFESVNLGTMSVSGITLTGEDYGEATALVFDSGAGNFVGANIDGQIFRITTGGAVSGLIDLDHTAKGLALIP
jgi:hypothetical protein